LGRWPLEDSSDQLTGRVVRTIYRGSDDYTVFVLDTGDENVTVVGSFPELQPGDEFEIGGTWTDHPRYGRQFRAHRFSEVLPDTTEGITAYLSSGLIRGVGPKIAQRIVEAFGTDALRVLEEDPERLLEIQGIAEKKKQQILSSFKQNRHLQETITRLQRYGLTLNLAMKLYREYGAEAPTVVEDDPYRLTEEVWGVGFKTADKIARAVGTRRDSPERLGAVIRYVLGQAAQRQGHLYLERPKLVQECVELLSPLATWEAEELADKLRGVILTLAGHGDVVLEDERVYLTQLHRAEEATAQNLARLVQDGPHLRLDISHIDRDISAVERQLELELAHEQRQAVRSALAEAVTVITGGPGTGKTTIVQAILETLARLNPNTGVLLAAPTGRAAQRLGEVTGLESKTIHRLLEYTFAEGRAFFARDEHSPLEGDLLIVDESSMIDSYLANALLRAVPNGMRVVFVGDADQLPPVGPGDFLRQLIDSEVVPVVRLTRIFRQDEASDIVLHAHQINHGTRPNFRTSSDVQFVRTEDGEDIADRVVEIVTREAGPVGRGGAPMLFGLKGPEAEVQVIAPMHRGPCGVAILNQRLQEALNPRREGQPELARGSTRFRTGDRVMCLRNNYQKGDSGIFNGNIGRVEQVVTADESGSEDGFLVIDFDGEIVTYTQGELDELALAYATTVHKAQGSEFPTVVLVVATQHYIMLHRNLLYTGYTRARERLYLVGSIRALHIAIKNARMRERNTRLAHRLQSRFLAN